MQVRHATAPDQIPGMDTESLRECLYAGRGAREVAFAGGAFYFVSPPAHATRPTAAVFLASSAADYVNGHVLAVDGGWLAR
ncbi:hypothetical protein Misp01_36430 [Microtetraspora sp. NBRC 13810]|uniref:hypothetical protein n=1 Tax=Microtetraspora sp. NBRC 13810 TaxID=3030990 RepID=UPI0024A5585F|nr:hypothetical protein [Microtetraspora sp. NBRC 13810]GLW08513.1 hypothetical protein Misp01_36430 [Microtetraspora sp. NBRC 13810]